MSIFLYHTLGCHLCELAEEVVNNVKSTEPQWSSLTVTKIDIADEPNLIEQYGIRIPVCKLDNCKQTLDWPFTEQEFSKYLAQFS